MNLDSIRSVVDPELSRRLARVFTLAIISAAIGWSLAVWHLYQTNVIPEMFAESYLQRGIQTLTVGLLFAITDLLWTLRSVVRSWRGEKHA